MKYSSDNQTHLPQKIHISPTPRIGGLGILLGLLASLAYFSEVSDHLKLFSFTFFSVLIFFIGFFEDILKKISSKFRLLMLSLVSGLAIHSLEIALTSVDIPFVNSLFLIPLISTIFTIICIVGLTNSYNILDGLNGLTGMTGLICLSSVTYIAYIMGDELVITFNLSILFSIAGFLAWNYPKGRVFLGDGGAYLIGFSIAISSLYLSKTYDQVSPWAFVLINIYPIFETLFTIARRIAYKRNPLKPDKAHLHTLLFRRIRKHYIKNKISKNNYQANSKTSFYAWHFNLISCLPATIFWSNTIAIIFAIVIFCVIYTYSYRKILSSRTTKKF